VSEFEAGDEVRSLRAVGMVTKGEAGVVTKVHTNGNLTCRFEKSGPGVFMLRSMVEKASVNAFETSLDAMLAEVRELMISRHEKYGPGNILRHGQFGVIVRLGDKYERLDNNRDDLADESVDDTVDDVIGYGIIMKMLRKGVWPGQKPVASNPNK
jgi:hypothetical protein